MANYHLTAHDIMQTEVATVLGDVSIQEAASIMRYEGVRSLLVEPREGSTRYGIITYSDIVAKVLAEGRDPRKMLVDEVAISDAVSIAPETSVQEVARQFRQHGIGHAPVIGTNGQLLGVLSITDLVTEIITEPH